MHRILATRLLNRHSVKQLSFLQSRFYNGSSNNTQTAQKTDTNVDDNSPPGRSSNLRDRNDVTSSHPTRRVTHSPEDDGGWMDKIVYSSFLEKYMPPSKYKERLRLRYEMKELTKDELVGKSYLMLPISTKYLLDTMDEGGGGKEANSASPEVAGDEESEDEQHVQFPYKIVDKTQFTEDNPSEEIGGEGKEGSGLKSRNLVSVGETLKKHSVDIESVLHGEASVADLFESALEVSIDDAGTPDPKKAPSNVPCGGCGALMHCQDKSVPGYISSEKFKKAKKRDLMAMVCYRCSVLETHQATLNVNVSPEDYPRIVGKIREKFAMAVLMVDLTDFPCSIWPGILDVIGTRRPIFLIGNKVDLLPSDSQDYLKRVEESLIKCAVSSGMLEANIIHTALISAKTGYGVESLITSIFNLGKGRGDVFIMGCTNVGKSSLFNLFLQSDLCKPQASDFVQRATISQWPGTTLNLLKFPMTSPQGWRQALRQRRLSTEMPVVQAEEKERYMQLRDTHNPEYAVLTGYVGKTFLSQSKLEAAEGGETIKDIFLVNPKHKVPPPSLSPGQWNPDDAAYSEGRWVYDTPGAVSENQILDLLTLPELTQSLPKTIIQPRTFFIKPGMSFFVGGLARLDFEEGRTPIRYTVFSNAELPVTMSLIEDADEVYTKALGTKVFSVPSGSSDRLTHFPPLKSRSGEFVGEGHNFSCMDIVVSSIGWIAVTAGHSQEFRLSIWTPDGKGIFIRKPALLPFAVNFKGKRIRGTYSYLPHKLYIPRRRK